MQRSDEEDPVTRIGNPEPTLEVWANNWFKEFDDRSWQMTVPSNGVAPPYATPTAGWPAGPKTWETKNTGAMSRMGIVLEEVTPPHVTPQGVAPQYCPFPQQPGIQVLKKLNLESRLTLRRGIATWTFAIETWIFRSDG